MQNIIHHHIRRTRGDVKIRFMRERGCDASTAAVWSVPAFPVLFWFMDDIFSSVFRSVIVGQIEELKTFCFGKRAVAGGAGLVKKSLFP